MHKRVFEGYLCDYFLTGGSRFRYSLQQVALARQHNLFVKVISGNPADLAALMLIGDKFGIRIEDVSEEVNKSPNSRYWLNYSEKGTVRIIIPEPSKRLGDFKPLLIYHFEKALREYRGNDPEHSEPLIHITYVLLVKYLAFSEVCPRPIGDIVAQDILALGKSTLFPTGRVSNRLESCRPEVYGLVRNMPIISQLYTGFAPSSMKDIPFQGNIANHRLNNYAFMSEQGGVATAILLRRLYYWTIPQLATVLTNLSLHDRQVKVLDEKVMSCLIARLKNKSEEEVSKSLGFTNLGKYTEWLSSNQINFGVEDGLSQFEKREKARQELGLPMDEEIEAMVGTSSNEESVKTTSSKTLNESETAGDPKESYSNMLNFSQDFRSFYINSQESEATPKQASVLSLIFDNWEAKTPAVAQGTVIQEVYPESNYKSLRKAFGNDTLYDLLIESGKSKGTVRFKKFSKIEVVNRNKSLEG